MVTRVIALDDHHLVREGIRHLLQGDEDVQLVAEGATGSELFPLVRSHQPDVVLLDLQMPQEPRQEEGLHSQRFHALSAVAQLDREFPDVAVIIISQHVSAGLAEGAVEVGVRGYILKEDAMTRQLVEAIRIVDAGGLYFSERVLGHLTGIYETQARRLLSRRHQEVLRSMAMHPDWLQTEHARRLGISENTLKKHLKQIYRALDVPNLTSAIIRAVQLQVLPATFLDPMFGVSPDSEAAIAPDLPWM